MCVLMESLAKIKNIDYCLDEDLKKLSSFGIGGKAKLVVYPKSISELVQTMSIFKKYIVIGNGTNLLFTDGYISKPIITTRRIRTDICINGSIVTVDAGTSLSVLCKECARQGLKGLENLYGIPATIGGAIYMNAGAFGSEISDYLYSVTIYENGKVKTLTKDDIKFNYRFSSFQILNCVILKATFVLQKENQVTIEQKIKENILWRQEHQPFGRSAGSVFKRADKPAGLLIDEAGLKGLAVGDAVVSSKHANFIINQGKARAIDVLTLISKIKNEIYLKFGILLEEEIQYIGDDYENYGRFPHTF